MKSKWIMNIGAFFLLGAVLTGCGTTTDDNDNMNNQRDGDVPLEQNERDNNINDQDNQNNRDGNMQENDNNIEEQLEEDQVDRNNNR